MGTLMEGTHSLLIPYVFQNPTPEVKAMVSSMVKLVSMLSMSALAKSEGGILACYMYCYEYLMSDKILDRILLSCD